MKKERGSGSTDGRKRSAASQHDRLSLVGEESQVEYAVTKRSGFHLTMEVRSLRFSSSLQFLNNSVSEDKDSESTSAGKASSLSRVTTLFKSLQADRQMQGFPSDDTHRWNLRFLDQELEFEYYRHVAKGSVLVATCVNIILFLYALMESLYYMELQSVSINYAVLSLYGVIQTICFAHIWKMLKNDSSLPIYSRIYYSAISFNYFVIVSLFGLLTIFRYDTVLSEVEFGVMIFTILLPGDYFWTIVVTIYSNIFPMALLLFTSPSNAVTFRCMVPLSLTTLLSLVTFRFLEKDRKRSFYFGKKLKWIKYQSTKSKKQKKDLLSNIYPIPVMNEIVRSNVVPVFKSNNCLVLCVSIRVSSNISESPDTVHKEIHSAFNMGMHRVECIGLQITAVSGLFGEDACRLLDPLDSLMSDERITQLKNVSISAGVGTGKAEGGIIQTSKSYFTIIGEAVDHAKTSCDLSSYGEVVVDNSTMETLKSELLKKMDKLIVFERRACISEIHFWTLQKVSDSYEGGIGGVSDRTDVVEISDGRKKPSHKEESGYTRRKSYIRSEQEHEELSNPFSMAKEKYGYMMYLGFLHFESDEESSYNQYIRTEKNMNIICLQMSMLFMSCILYGVIDFDLLLVCENFELNSFLPLLTRYGVVTPLIGLSVLFSYLHKGNIYTMHHYFDSWSLPVAVGVLYSAFSLSRLIYIYHFLNIGHCLDSDKYIFLVTEVYKVGMFYASLVVFSPAQFLAHIYIWVLVLVPLNLQLFLSLGGSLVSSLLLTVVSIVSPSFVLYIFSFFREIAFRRTYLGEKFLQKKIHELDIENEDIEKALRSSMSSEMFEDLKLNKFSSQKTIDGAILITVELTFPFSNHEKTDTQEKFRLIAECTKEIECLGKSYQLETLKTNGLTIIIQSSPLPENEGGFDAQVHRAFNFSFKTRGFIADILKGDNFAGLSSTIFIDQGTVTYGVIGDGQFAFDSFGSTVHRSLYITKNANTDGVLYPNNKSVWYMHRTDNTFASLPPKLSTALTGFALKSSKFSITHTSDLVLNDGESVPLYILAEKTDIWGLFVQGIDWIDPAALPEECNEPRREIRYTDIVAEKL